MWILDDHTPLEVLSSIKAHVKFWCSELNSFTKHEVVSTEKLGWLILVSKRQSIYINKVHIKKYLKFFLITSHYWLILGRGSISSLNACI